MRLTPTEVDRLTIFTAAELARRRRARAGSSRIPRRWRSSATTMHEAARGGASYEAVRRRPGARSTAADVLDGVPELIGTSRSNASSATACACFTWSSRSDRAPARAGRADGGGPDGAGEILFGEGPIAINAGRRTAEVDVLNLSDHTIFVSSHFPFFEVNRRLVFDRARAWGMHLDIPAGDSVRWRPGRASASASSPSAGAASSSASIA